MASSPQKPNEPIAAAETSDRTAGCARNAVITSCQVFVEASTPAGITVPERLGRYSVTVYANMFNLVVATRFRPTIKMPVESMSEWPG